MGAPAEVSPSGATLAASAPLAEAPVGAGAAGIQPKGKGQLDSKRVQNPHDPEATYAVKGQGQQKKEHVGYKVQVAETVSEAVLAPGEPTRNFITGIKGNRVASVYLTFVSFVAFLFSII